MHSELTYLNSSKLSISYDFGSKVIAHKKKTSGRKLYHYPDVNPCIMDPMKYTQSSPMRDGNSILFWTGTKGRETIYSCGERVDDKTL